MSALLSTRQRIAFIQLWGALLGIVALLVWLAPARADAASTPQTDSIHIITNTAKVRYRTGVDFQINATSTGGGVVTQAQLKVQFGTHGVTSTYDVSLTNEAGSHLIADDTEDLTTGMPLTYSWILSDGKVRLQTVAQTVVYEDTGHKWQQMAGDKLTLRWYDGDNKYGVLMYQLGSDALGTYKRRFNMDPTKEIYITIYGSDSAYHQAFPEAPAWSGGLTRYGGVEIIVIAPSNMNSSVFIGEGIPHELSHAAVYQFLGKPAPRWLDEGFAVYNQNTISIKEYDDLVQTNYASNSLIPLADIATDWPADANAAMLAYAEGRSIVTFLINTYGNQAWSNLLDQLRWHDIDGALKACFGVDLAQMELLWKSKVLAHDNTVKMPPALKLGPVASQPTANNMVAQSQDSIIAGTPTEGDSFPWLLLSGVVFVLAIIATLVVIRRYHKLNAVAFDQFSTQVVPRRMQMGAMSTAPLPTAAPSNMPPLHPARTYQPNSGQASYPMPVGQPQPYATPPRPGWPAAPAVPAWPVVPPVPAYGPTAMPSPSPYYNAVPAPVYGASPIPPMPVYGSNSVPPTPAYGFNPTPPPSMPSYGSNTVPPAPAYGGSAAGGGDPFDLIMANFGQPKPAAPARPSQPTDNSNHSFLALDPYGLQFDAPASFQSLDSEGNPGNPTR